MMDIDKAFEKYTSRRTDKYGYHVACTKGLWEVCGPDKSVVENEAIHYFWQYFEDGEYAT